MTTNVDTLVELPIEKIAAHPRNIRRPGDVTDLAKSIAQVGILEPLIVLPADGNGIHHLVAGHRRTQAAHTAGLTTVPCIIRTFDDDSDIVLAMIGENTNQGRLSIVEEAQALAAVIDLKGGVLSVPKLAKAVGHSQGWVKTRLSILVLTDRALDSLHDGKLTLDVAAALTSLADEPDVIDRLVKQRPLSVWQVEQEIRTLRQHATLTTAVERLIAKGVTVVSETDQTEHARVWRTVDDAVGREQARAHRSEPCHAVLVKVAWDGTTAAEIALCIEPRRHKGATPASTLPAAIPTIGGDPTGAAERRDRKAAAQARTEWLTERLATRHPFPTADATRLALLTWLDTITATQAERTAVLLGLDAGQTGWNQVLLDEVEADPKRLAPVAATVAIVIAEETVRALGVNHKVARRYLDMIETWGYQPCEIEHSERLKAS
jgi:ParB/RepB/Spo0J family partition protein